MATAEHDEQPQPTHEEALPHRGKIKRCWHWLLTHKKIAIPAAVAALVIILVAVPLTRFAIAGTFLKQQFSVKIIDKETNKPVSSAEVTIAGKSALTDGQGKATVKARVGQTQLTVEKKYYKSVSQSAVVPILKQKQVSEVKLEATGRQVPITVINKITKKAVAGVAVAAGEAEARTDKEGKATLVVPANKREVEATFSADGYNTTKLKLEVKAGADVAEVAVTPAGKVYFLSNLTGKLDVVKSNLDGTDRRVVLAGTGKEDKRGTVLLASRDWKYLALLSKRDGGEYAKLFLIETATDRLTTMDEGKAHFALQGWNDHHFVYKVERTEVNYWEPKRVAIKSYEAEAHKITTLDQTVATGNQNSYVAQDFANVFIIGDQVIYTVGWNGNVTAESAVIRGVKANGQGKKDLKTFEPTLYGWHINANPYEFNSIYIEIYDKRDRKSAYFELEDNTFKQVQINSEEFYAYYPTYYISPSAGATLRGELRDGKQALFVGDKNGENERQIAPAATYQPHGWFTDEYLLVSKDGSELYVLPAAGLKAGKEPLKITDYYKSDYTIRGYGGGY